MTDFLPNSSFSHVPLVFDASALINILSTNHSAAIFKHIKTNNFVETLVIREITRNSHSKARDVVIRNLLDNNHLKIVDMSQEETSHFIHLISAPFPDALDDGEAATLAIAKHRNCTAIIDEKKAMRIANTTTPPMSTKSTLDILKWASQEKHLNPSQTSEAILNALITAKMRVPLNFEEWITSILNADDLIRCTSLRKELRDSCLQQNTPGCIPS